MNNIAKSVFVNAPTYAPGSGINSYSFSEITNEATEYSNVNLALTGDYNVTSNKAILTVASRTTGAINLPAFKIWSDIMVKNYSTSTVTVNTDGLQLYYLGTAIGTSISVPANSSVRILADQNGWFVVPEELSVVRSAVVTISPAEILALNATPKVLVPAMTGLYYQPLEVSVQMDYKTAAYTVTGVTGTDVKVGTSTFFTTPATTIYTATSDKRWVLPTAVSALTELFGNTAITFTTTGASPAAGDGTITVEILYKINTFG